jgi:hypothetical protein
MSLCRSVLGDTDCSFTVSRGNTIQMDVFNVFKIYGGKLGYYCTNIHLRSKKIV